MRLFAYLLISSDFVFSCRNLSLVTFYDHMKGVLIYIEHAKNATDYYIYIDTRHNSNAKVLATIGI